MNVIGKGDWLSLRVKGDGYEYLHEDRCQGKIVAVLGFVKGEDGQVRILARSEYTPCWVPGEERTPTISALTGGVEPGEDPDEAAYREAFEEAGIDSPSVEWYSLGQTKGTKSTDTDYFIYACVLTEADFKEQTEGDGSQAEAEAKNVLLTLDEALEQMVDPVGLAIIARSMLKSEIWGGQE